MRARLNLATSPLENKRRFVLLAGLGAVVGLALFVVLLVQTTRNWRENRDVRDEIARLESEMREFRAERRKLEDYFKLPETRRITDRAAFLNSLIEQRSFPWTQVFTVVERRLPIGVRIISIAPSMNQGRVEVKIVCGAISDETKLKFLKALVESDEFSTVRVTSESRPVRSDEGDTVVMELLARYAPGAGKPSASAAAGAAGQ